MSNRVKKINRRKTFPLSTLVFKLAKVHHHLWKGCQVSQLEKIQRRDCDFLQSGACIGSSSSDYIVVIESRSKWAKTRKTVVKIIFIPLWMILNLWKYIFWYPFKLFVNEQSVSGWGDRKRRPRLCFDWRGAEGGGGNDHIDWQDLTHGRQCAKAMSYVFVGNWSLCCAMRVQSINAIILSRCTISFWSYNFLLEQCFGRAWVQNVFFLCYFFFPVSNAKRSGLLRGGLKNSRGKQLLHLIFFCI